VTAPFTADAESIVRVSFSGSVSFDKTSIVTDVSSVVTAASEFATGASLMLLTITATVEVAVPPLPSLMS